jgi:hypothetical protein
MAAQRPQATLITSARFGKFEFMVEFSGINAKITSGSSSLSRACVPALTECDLSYICVTQPFDCQTIAISWQTVVIQFGATSPATFLFLAPNQN